MSSRCNNQDDRLLKLEHSLLAMNNAIQGSHSLFLGLQAECRRIDAMVTKHETSLARLRQKVETSTRRVNTVLSLVEERVKEFEIWINEVRQSNMNTEIPMEIVNSLNKIIQESAPSAAVEVIRQQLEKSLK